jgi:hypothetical protein
MSLIVIDEDLDEAWWNGIFFKQSDKIRLGKRKRYVVARILLGETTTTSTNVLQGAYK